jgi:hypothetical protein
MAVKSDEQEYIELYRKSSIFRNITRKDGNFWEASDICEFEVFDNSTGESVDSGDINKSEDQLKFELRYTNTETWERGKTYTLIVRISNTDNGYSDVVLEITAKVK